ncbi:MAG: S41 family peptidase [Burkholderiaceae bacterium]
MKLKRALVLHGLCATALSLAATHAVAAPPRAACALHAASGDVPSQAADALSVSLDAAHPAGLANWDVRWWQRHRVWIALEAVNRGDATAHLLPQMLVDARADGGAATLLVGPPITLAPHARASDHLAIYVPDDARTLGLRMLGAGLADSVAVTLSTECSDARFEPGEMAPAVGPLFEEAMRTYFNGFVDPLTDPRASFEAVHALASGAQDSSDVAWAMRGLMQSVHDVHGYVVGPGEVPPARRTLVTRATEFELRQDGSAVVRLHPVDTRAEADALAWATALHDGVAALAARHPRAWIVDLRDHDADTPWAAFAGLSSLLGGPAVGAYVSRHESQDWIADRGSARIAGGPALIDVQAPPEPAFLGPLAVLIGPSTRNAGEDLAVAFRGRARTRSFGTATAGFPFSGVREHRLSDGSVLGVLETRAADRTGVVQRQPLEADSVLAPDVSQVALPQEAIDWVLDEHARATGRQ